MLAAELITRLASGETQAGAVDARSLNATGDGVTDDWAALQAALDAHRVVVLPKGVYRLSRPLVLRRDHGALVGPALGPQSSAC